MPRPTRLETLAHLVSSGSRVADIGTDHAQLPALLLAHHAVEFVVATERTRATLTACPDELRALGARLEVRFGDGLEPLEVADRLDTVVVAGMGGARLVGLLQRGRLTELGIRRLVLQPQTEIPRVRAWLYANAYPLVDERLIRERGRYYVALLAEPDTQGRTGPEHEELLPAELLEAGPCLVRSPDPLVREYWQAQLRRLDHILDAATVGLERDRASAGARLARRVLDVLPRA